MTLKIHDIVLAASVKAMCALVDGTKGNSKLLKRRLAELDRKADRILAATALELLDWDSSMESTRVENWKR